MEANEKYVDRGENNQRSDSGGPWKPLDVMLVVPFRLYERYCSHAKSSDKGGGMY